MSWKISAGLPYEQSYLGRLHQQVGSGPKLLAVTVRGVVCDEQGRVLLVQRRDNQQWVMPAGSIELDEPILDALKREVWEESGLEVTAATLIAVYSDPRFSITTAYGDSYQIIAFVFRVDAWDSALAAETDETISARFFPLDALPAMYHETLADLLRFDGTVILK